MFKLRGSSTIGFILQLCGSCDQLPELTLQSGKIQPEFGPAAAINLLQQPAAITVELLEQIIHAGRGWIRHLAQGSG